MRQGILFPIFLTIGLGGIVWAAGGDLGGGNGTQECPYLIQDLSDFQEFCDHSLYWSQYTRLECDLDLSSVGVYDQAPIAGDATSDIRFWGTTFKGHFDGNRHSISNLSVSGGYYGGLFGYVVGGTIINLGIKNTYVSGTGYIGGLCGWNSGHIINCYSTGSADGDELVGGLCGRNDAVISSCYSTADVTAVYGAGGLCGINEGEITNCYSNGTVSWDTAFEDPVGYIGGFCGYNKSDAAIVNCYAAGSVIQSGLPDYFGGLCGNSYGQIDNSFWNIDLCSFENGFGNPLDDPNMMIQANFIGWDFVGESTNGQNEIWRMCCDGVDWPRLSWEFSKNGDFACGDGVDIDDLRALAECWLLTKALDPAIFSEACDANGDGVIDLLDYSVLAVNW